MPCPSPRDLPEPGIEPRSPTVQADFFTIWATKFVGSGKPQNCSIDLTIKKKKKSRYLHTSSFLKIFFFKLEWVFRAVRGCLQLWWVGDILCDLWASHRKGFSCCGEWALGLPSSSCSSTWAPGTWNRHSVPCITRQIVNHWTTREAPHPPACVIFLFTSSKVTFFFTFWRLKCSFHRLTCISLNVLFDQFWWYSCLCNSSHYQNIKISIIR